jgi:hypothetical protein
VLRTGDFVIKTRDNKGNSVTNISKHGSITSKNLQISQPNCMLKWAEENNISVEITRKQKVKRQ